MANVWTHRKQHITRMYLRFDCVPDTNVIQFAAAMNGLCGLQKLAGFEVEHVRSFTKPDLAIEITLAGHVGPWAQARVECAVEAELSRFLQVESACSALGWIPPQQQ